MNTITRYISSSVNTWLSGMALVLFNQAVIAGSLNISDTPLFLTVSMAPNLVLTLDDSLSMPSAAVPDDINNDDTYNRYKASYYNALYYNPNITYTPPPKYNGTTCSLAENIATCYPNISFTSAPLNGFAPSRGTPVNLNTAYIATKSFSPESTTQTNAGTPDGSSTYYKVDVPVTTTIPAVSYSIKCSVTFTNNSSTDQINISSCTATTGYPAATNFSSISGKTGITVTVTGSSRDGAYTNVTYSSTSRIIVGSKWTTTVGPTSNVTLTWTIPATSSTSTTTTYPAYYYQFYTEVTPAIAAPSGCSANPVKTNDACYVKTIVPENQKQNFANWFSYYRTRNLAVVSSTMRALANIDDNTRVAWQSLNMATASASRPRCDSFGINCDGWSATGDMIGLDKDNRIRRLNAVLGNGKTHKQELFEWLSRFPVAGYTLTLKAAQRAGDYFTGDTGIQHPYADDPHYRQYPLNPDGSSKTSYDACRRNVHILVTDGGWCTNNQGSKEVTVGDTNSSSVTVPLGPNNQVNYNWTPPYPYKDKQADNFADVAFKYWATDLQPTLANNLKPVIKDLSRWSDDTNIDLETEQWTNPKNDPATWQHLTTYAVGLGLKTTLASPYTSWGGSTFAAVTSSIPEDGYPRLKLGTGCPGSTTSTSTASSYCWPYTDPLKSCPPVAADQQRKTYDLWHAAISSRGKFFSSESPDDLVNAFNSIFTEVESNNASAAAAAANSTQTGNDTALFLAQFNSKDWSGHLLDFLVANNGSVSNNIADAKWDAAESAQLNAEGNDALRHIVTFNGSTGVTFEWNSLSDAQRALLNTNPVTNLIDNRGSDRLAWLRGQSISSFRSRPTTVLGDIVNSDPYYTWKEDLGYATKLPNNTAGKSTYSSFVAGKNSRPAMIYVGANDGMLHGFTAANSNPPGGQEMLAYVPAAIYDHLNRLPETDYAHRYYVDGSPMIGDAYLTVSGTPGWKTVLVGGLNKGGKAIYALDISDPSAYAGASPGSNVLWEYSGSPTVASDGSSVTDAEGMGYTFSQPQIGLLHNGHWAAIFGNGYDSASGHSYLYIVDLSDGSLIKRIATDTSIIDNGLSTPRLYDSTGDGIVDYVYAGDLQGNMWKFDLTSSDTGAWAVANGVPLFKARYNGTQVQPITAQPTIEPHTLGHLVFFGTGRYLSDSDKTDNSVQTFYAILDRNSASTTVSASTLVQQTIEEVRESGSFTNTLQNNPNCIDDPATPTVNECALSYSLRITSNNEVDYVAGKNGWYMNMLTLPSNIAEGERIVSSALVKYDRVIFLTIIPSFDPCIPAGYSWLMEVDAVSGKRTAVSSFDFNNDNQFDSYDLLQGSKSASGVRSEVGMIKQAVWLENEGTGTAFKENYGSSTQTMAIKNKSKAAVVGKPTRDYWLQIQ